MKFRKLTESILRSLNEGSDDEYILYHGRFQPPHDGHFKLIESALEKYPQHKMVISIDVRDKDDDNPFDYDYRKNKFIEKFGINPNFEIRHHETHECVELIDYVNVIHENVEDLNVNVVIGGPSFHAVAKDYWTEQGMEIWQVSERFFNLSATDIRKKMKDDQN